MSRRSGWWLGEGNLVPKRWRHAALPGSLHTQGLEPKRGNFGQEGRTADRILAHKLRGVHSILN